MYSVKNVKTFPGHDDGLGMNCNLYKNNKKVATVHDDAWGGAFHFNWVNNTESDILDNYLETFPKYFFIDEMHTHTQDTFVDKLVMNVLIGKEAKVALRKRFILITDEGNFLQFKKNGCTLESFGTYIDESKQYNGEVANLMDFDKFLELYKEYIK